jgi:hypothetical protein
MAEKKEYDRKAIAVANLNAQKANMRMGFNEIPDREATIGKKKEIPELTIRSSFDHSADLVSLGMQRRWDGAANREKDHHSKINEGYELMSGGLTMTVTGEESLKILAEAGVDFPGADQFMSPVLKATRGSSKSRVI